MTTETETRSFDTLSLKDLQDERLAMGKQIKELAELDNEAWNGETEQRWQDLNADYDTCVEVLDKKLKAVEASKERHARAEAIDRYKHAVSQTGLRERQATWRVETQEQLVAQRELRKALCLQAWLYNDYGRKLTPEMRQACHDLEFDPSAKFIDACMPRGDNLRGYQAFQAGGGLVLRHFEERWNKGALITPELEQRDLTTGPAPDAGATIPEGFVRELDRALLAFGGVRRGARILTTSGDNPLPWPTTDDTSNAAVLIAEGADAGASVDPTFGQVIFNAYKFTSNPVLVTAETLDDSAFNMSAVIASMLGERIGRGTSTYFTGGTGTGQPEGITQAPVGKTTASNATFTLDEILDFIHSIDPSYRAFGSTGFVFHDQTLLVLRKQKDDEGRYYWQPGTVVGEPDRLFGFPYIVDNSMPTIAANAKVAAFGALEKFVIRDHAAFRFYRLEERYRVEKDSTGFIAFSRHDSRLLDAGTNPIKVLQMAA